MKAQYLIWEDPYSLFKTPTLKSALHFAQIETTCQLIYLQNSEKAKVSDFNKKMMLVIFIYD